MQDSGQYGGTTVGEYTGALQRRWWVVVLGAVVGLGLAAGFLLVAPKTYVATAAVLVNPIGGDLDNAVDGARTNSGVNLDTEAQLVTSQAVSSRAQVALATTEPPGQLMKHVAVEVPANTNVLRISFAGSTPEEARAGADAFAKSYLNNRRDTTIDLLNEQERALRQQIAALTNELAAASADERPGLEASLQTLNTRLSYVVGTRLNPGEIISYPLLPKRPTSPNAALVLTSGLAFGLLLGLAALYLLERRDTRCHDWRSVERRLGLAVLADVPGSAGDAVEVFDPHTAGAEAYAGLRNAILSGLGDGGATIVISSPSAGAGADAVAVNLAVTLARAGHESTLVVADGDSAIAQLTGVDGDGGLAGVLAGDLAVDRSLHSVPSVDHLRVLPAGADFTKQVDDLEGSGIGPVLDKLAAESQFVIVRARPNDDSADAQFFGRHARAAIPVIEVGATLRPAVENAVRQWQLVGTAVPGAVTVPELAATS